MRTTSSRLIASLRRAVAVSSLGLALGAAFGGAIAPVQAAPGARLAMGVGVARANRIARDFVGRGAYVVRNEGVHNGMYRIHVHQNGVARHVFVGVRSGRVIKTRVIKRSADRREDGR